MPHILKGLFIILAGNVILFPSNKHVEKCHLYMKKHLVQHAVISVKPAEAYEGGLST
jgi:hypothetical protein